MKSKAEEFVAQLLNGEPHRQPIESSGEGNLPAWFDEEKYNRGRKFFVKYFFGFVSSYLIGLMILLAIPSISKVLLGTLTSASSKAAYRRYRGTMEQLFNWVYYDLKPGSKSWNSFHLVRKLHLKAMNGAKLKGYGPITQRDVGLTLGAAVSYAYLKPDEFGIFQDNSDDWEAYNHFWAVIAHFMGLEDIYNMCLRSFEESCEIGQILIDRVFAPCLENPPEYFEHILRISLEGVSAFYAPGDVESVMFITKNLSGVPGYLMKESERILLKKKIMKLTEHSPDIGIKSTDLMEKCTIDGIQEREPRMMYASDYNSIETSPAYRQLSLSSKFKIVFVNTVMTFYCTSLGRIFLNCFIKSELFVAKYFPYLAIWRFGFSAVFLDDVTDNGVWKPNSEFNKP